MEWLDGSRGLIGEHREMMLGEAEHLAKELKGCGGFSVMVEGGG